MEPWWRMSDVSCSLSVKRQMLSLRPGANCQKWSDSGSMDFQSVSATWMYARAVGEPLNSDDPDQGIPFMAHRMALLIGSSIPLKEARTRIHSVRPVRASTQQHKSTAMAKDRNEVVS